MHIVSARSDSEWKNTLKKVIGIVVFINSLMLPTTSMSIKEKLAKNINCSRTKLQNYLAFQKVPLSIWEAVGNLSKISARTAATIHALSLRGKEVISILISLADEIRKGIGSTRLENLMNQQLLDQVPNSSHEIRLSLPSGVLLLLGKTPTLNWTKMYQLIKINSSNMLLSSLLNLSTSLSTKLVDNILDESNIMIYYIFGNRSGKSIAKK